MSQALLLVLYFLGEPTATEKQAIFLYERSRQTKVELRALSRSVRSSPSTTYPSYDEALVRRIEAELDKARTAAASLDEKHALEILADVENELRAHPELPQAAWLMAERHRVAARVGELASSERASLVARAEALEGPRALELGAALEPAAELVQTRVSVEGLTARDRLELDGALVSSEPTLVPGEHHVRVLRGERLMYAGWVTVEPSATTLALPVIPVAACSNEDVGGVRVEGGRAFPEPGTVCPRWAVAERAPNGLRIAECFGDRCGPFAFYSARERSALAAQPARDASPDLVWKLALGGAAVVATTLAILWQTGAFEPAPPRETRWVYGGARPAP